MRRQGMGAGKGKGYKNLAGRDPKVHSDSAKGRKQPQKLPNSTLRKIEQKEKETFSSWKIFGKTPSGEVNKDHWSKVVISYQDERMGKGKARFIHLYLSPITENTSGWTKVKVKSPGANIREKNEILLEKVFKTYNEARKFSMVYMRKNDVVGGDLK